MSEDIPQILDPKAVLDYSQAKWVWNGREYVKVLMTFLHPRPPDGTETAPDSPQEVPAPPAPPEDKALQIEPQLTENPQISGGTSAGSDGLEHPNYGDEHFLT